MPTAAILDLPVHVLNKSDRLRTTELPDEVQTLANSDPRIASLVHYEEGWVPNSYRYRAPGACTHYYRRPNGWWAVVTGTYDRKRSRGVGPTVVAFSVAYGRLASS